jgi:hypothetical protein
MDIDYGKPVTRVESLKLSRQIMIDAEEERKAKNDDEKDTILMSVEQIFKDVENELIRANKKFPNFHSPHEGYGVIKEEFEELWDQIKINKTCTGNRLMRNEAIQVAAMAVKFIDNLCDVKVV